MATKVHPPHISTVWLYGRIITPTKTGKPTKNYEKTKTKLKKKKKTKKSK